MDIVLSRERGLGSGLAPRMEHSIAASPRTEWRLAGISESSLVSSVSPLSELLLQQT